MGIFLRKKIFPSGEEPALAQDIRPHPSLLHPGEREKPRSLASQRPSCAVWGTLACSVVCHCLSPRCQLASAILTSCYYFLLQTRLDYLAGFFSLTTNEAASLAALQAIAESTSDRPAGEIVR